jgi:enoyl-CoA hydratase/carnithine racemase
MEIIIQNQIARIITTDPKRENFFDEGFYRNLLINLQQLELNEEVKVVIFGAGTSRHFCSGLNTKFLNELSKNNSKIEVVIELLNKIRHFKKPTIAGINGGCVGISLGFVLAFDIRFCTDEAYFKLIGAEQSLIFENQTILNLFDQINRIHFNEMLFSERNVSGIEAEKLNIVNKSCYDRETLEEDLENIAKQIIQKDKAFKL